MILRLVKYGSLMKLRVNLLPTHESYLEGKMIKTSFLGKGDQVKEVLGLVHSNVCCPMNIQTHGGYELCHIH